MLLASRRIFVVTVLLVLSASSGFAQYAQLTQGKVIKGIEARQLAAKKGWVIRRETASGLIELKAVVNGMPQYYITHNANAADTISTDECLPGGSTGLNLTGYGVILGVWDGGGVRTTHQEFGGRAIQMDSPNGTHYHATHVAGTMVAGGVDLDAMGMAPVASLDCYDWSDDATEMRTAAQNGLLVSNHSYGAVCGWHYDYFGDGNWIWLGDYRIDSYEDYRFGLYTHDSWEHDDIAYDNPQYLIVKSGGNERNDDGPGDGVPHYVVDWSSGMVYWSDDTHKPDGEYDCVGPVASAKNVLAVGAVYDIFAGYHGPTGVYDIEFSSYGPTDDGRIKPDIVANGAYLYSTFDGSDSEYAAISGTSMSAPSASGSLGLLIQHWRNTHSVSPDMRSATLKGLVLHTADESGAANGPDYGFGWGLMNTQKAAQVISADVTEPLTISEQTIDNGENLQLVVTAGTGELRASICWTDPPATPPGFVLDPTTKMLINDLDLRLERTSSGTTYYPWVLDPANPASAATTGDNNTDNVEQIVIYSPASANYLLTVNHKGSLFSGSQDYSLIITGATSISTVQCDDNGDCDDNDVCNGYETCDSGLCQPGISLVCDDGKPCTDDSCDPITGCQFVNDNSNSCDDGDLCNGGEYCLGGNCRSGTPLVCDDGKPCTDDSCDPVSGCQFVNDDTNACGDGVDCTDDTCQNGNCISLPNDANCSDVFFCNGSEICDALVGCVSPGDPCDSTSWCDESLDVCEPYGDGDFDDDGDVDLEDFARFQLCFAKSASGGCEPANMTGDEMVDLDDYHLAFPLITGPGKVVE